MNNEIINNNNPPSLCLSFDWLKDVLENQIQDARFLTDREISVFTIASAIIGFAIPLALTELKISVNLWFYTSVGFYGLLVLLLIYSLFQKQMDDLKNPVIIRESYWDMKPEEFKMELLTYMEDAYADNKKVINLKRRVLNAIIGLTGVEVVSLILFILRGIHVF
jgi:hypothetical protein